MYGSDFVKILKARGRECIKFTLIDLRGHVGKVQRRQRIKRGIEEIFSQRGGKQERRISTMAYFFDFLGPPTPTLTLPREGRRCNLIGKWVWWSWMTWDVCKVYWAYYLLTSYFFLVGVLSVNLKQRGNDLTTQPCQEAKEIERERVRGMGGKATHFYGLFFVSVLFSSFFFFKPNKIKKTRLHNAYSSISPLQSFSFPLTLPWFCWLKIILNHIWSPLPISNHVPHYFIYHIVCY